MANLIINGIISANNLKQSVIDIQYLDNGLIRYFSDGYCEMFLTVEGTKGSITTLTYPQELTSPPRLHSKNMCV